MSSHGRVAVFVDRDGTLVEERDYLADPDQVMLLPGAPRALRDLQGAGLLLVLVSNQSGIARGLYGEEDYRRVTERMEELLAREGVALDSIQYCPHHPDYTGPCRCRKPGPGMYLAAAQELGLGLESSYYIGDKLSDVEPALAFGGKGILVRTGYGRDFEGSVPAGVRVLDDLAEAARSILREVGHPGSQGAVDPRQSQG